MKILVADYSQTSLADLSDSLKKLGHEAIVANSYRRLALQKPSNSLPRFLELEFTESIVMNPSKRVEKNI